MIKIDTDVPIPAEITVRKMKYPWLLLEIGHSFVWTGDVAHVHTMCSRAGRDHGRKFRAAKEDNGNDRVWRVA